MNKTLKLKGGASLESKGKKGRSPSNSKKSTQSSHSRQNNRSTSKISYDRALAQSIYSQFLVNEKEFQDSDEQNIIDNLESIIANSTNYEKTVLIPRFLDTRRSGRKITNGYNKRASISFFKLLYKKGIKGVDPNYKSKKENVENVEKTAKKNASNNVSNISRKLGRTQVNTGFKNIGWGSVLEALPK